MKIAVLGTGSIGRRHLKNLKQLGITDLVAVSTHKKIDRCVIDGTTIPVLHTLQSAVDSNIDAIFICDPSIFHVERIRTALLSNKHIYVEKPAGTAIKGLAEMLVESKRRRLTVAVGYQFRFNELLNKFYDWYRSGAAGRVINVSAVLGEHIEDFHPSEDFRLSYAAQANLGGGVLLSQIHQINYLNWIFGPFNNVKAIGGGHSSLGIDVEDCVSYLLETENGLPVMGQIDFLSRPKRMTISVFGSDSHAHWDYNGNAVSITGANNNATPEIFDAPLDRNWMFMNSVKDFLEAVRLQKRPRSGLEEGLNDLLVVDAIKRSLSSGQTEAIDKC